MLYKCTAILHDASKLDNNAKRVYIYGFTLQNLCNVVKFPRLTPVFMYINVH